MITNYKNLDISNLIGEINKIISNRTVKVESLSFNTMLDGYKVRVYLYAGIEEVARAAGIEPSKNEGSEEYDRLDVEAFGITFTQFVQKGKGNE